MAKKILVVDDEEEMRQFMTDVLTGAGYDVIPPVDSYAALELAQTEAYDLIILDDEMPLLDGRSLVKILRESGVQTPVIFLSGASESEGLEPSRQLAVNEVIRKPFRVGQLLDSTNSILTS